MTALPSVTGKSLLTALRSAGFMVVRSKSSHHFLRQGVFLWREWQALETAQGWLPRRSALLVAAQFAVQLWRMREEEKVLQTQFPEYAAYRARTARLIPGVY
jgi:protein-S-isoprenylcysteine O-methyltransferase Ste14